MTQKIEEKIHTRIQLYVKAWRLPFVDFRLTRKYLLMFYKAKPYKWLRKAFIACFCGSNNNYFRFSLKISNFQYLFFPFWVIYYPFLFLLWVSRHTPYFLHFLSGRCTWMLFGSSPDPLFLLHCLKWYIFSFMYLMENPSSSFGLLSYNIFQFLNSLNYILNLTNFTGFFADFCAII